MLKWIVVVYFSVLLLFHCQNTVNLFTLFITCRPLGIFQFFLLLLGKFLLLSPVRSVCVEVELLGCKMCSYSALMSISRVNSTLKMSAF